MPDAFLSVRNWPADSREDQRAFDRTLSMVDLERLPERGDVFEWEGAAERQYRATVSRVAHRLRARPGGRGAMVRVRVELTLEGEA